MRKVKKPSSSSKPRFTAVVRSSPSRMRHSKKRQAASVSLSVTKRMPSGSSFLRTRCGFDKRAVVHQAEVFAGGERMRMRRRHRGLRGHARVRHHMRARDLVEPVALDDVGGRARVLVQVDGTPHRQHVAPRAPCSASHSRTAVGAASVRTSRRDGRWRRIGVCPRTAERCEALPVRPARHLLSPCHAAYRAACRALAPEQRDLVRLALQRLAEDGHTRGIGPAARSCPRAWAS